ncbi:MAG: Gfo/Idh/MocA family protein [Candidatus Methylomirabilia bacterium]
MKPLNLALLGCGWIARRHAAAARALRGQLALSFASRDPRQAEAYRARYGGLTAYGSYEAAVADPAIDGVIICTPHDRHLEDTLLAFSHGKHVLVEKPMARTLPEADQMIEAARAAGATLMVAENYRFMPAFRTAGALLAQGWLGALRQIHIRAWGYRDPAGWRLSAQATGGGALIDGGIHYVDLLVQWGGQPAQVYALSPPNTLSGLGGEDTMSLLVQLSDRVVGFLSVSLATRGIPRLQWSTLTGTAGAAFVDNRGRLLWLRSSRGQRLRVFLSDARGYRAMVMEFVRAVREGRPPQMNGTDGRRDLALVVAAYRSSESGLPVEVEW